MMPIRWTPQAENDLTETVDYLEIEWGLKSIEKFLYKLDHMIHLIQTQPFLFPAIDENPEVKKCLITKHNTLYFRIQEREIVILSIWSNYKDPDRRSFINRISVVLFKLFKSNPDFHFNRLFAFLCVRISGFTTC